MPQPYKGWGVFYWWSKADTAYIHRFHRRNRCAMWRDNRIRHQKLRYISNSVQSAGLSQDKKREYNITIKKSVQPVFDLN